MNEPILMLVPKFISIIINRKNIESFYDTYLNEFFPGK